MEPSMAWFKWLVDIGVDSVLISFLKNNAVTIGMVIFFGTGLAKVLTPNWDVDDKVWEILRGWQKTQPGQPVQPPEEPVK